MAFILLKDSPRLVAISPEKAAIMWRVKEGEIKGTKEQRQFVARIRRFFLNRDNAPESYRKKHQSEPYDSGPVMVRRGKVIKKEKVAQVRLPYVD